MQKKLWQYLHLIVGKKNRNINVKESNSKIIHEYAYVHLPPRGMMQVVDTGVHYKPM